MNSFIQYSNVLLDGFQNNHKTAEVINKKRDLLESILDHYNLTDNNMLFVGFSPWCLSLGQKKFKITSVSSEVLAYLDSQGVNYEYRPLEDWKKDSKSASIVVAVDEYFTFADSDAGQRQLVEQLANLAQDIIVTTLRDYKNQDFKDREFSQPIMIRGNNGGKIFLEHYEYDLKDKNANSSSTYAIGSDSSEMYGPFARRNMYFKQLAKFSLDAGAENFYVHKNLMYKSVIKKNYEHVISIKF
jgi:hypothetical protein